MAINGVSTHCQLFDVPSKGSWHGGGHENNGNIIWARYVVSGSHRDFSDYRIPFMQSTMTTPEIDHTQIPYFRNDVAVL